MSSSHSAHGSGGGHGHGGGHGTPGHNTSFQLAQTIVTVITLLLGILFGFLYMNTKDTPKEESATSEKSATTTQLKKEEVSASTSLEEGGAKFVLPPGETEVVDKKSFYYDFSATDSVKFVVISRQKNVLGEVTTKQSGGVPPQFPNPHRYLKIQNTGPDTVTISFFNIHE